MMENKKIGIILILFAVILIASTAVIKAKEDAMINKIVQEQGSCFLDDGTCLHNDRSSVMYIVSWIVSAALAALGVYLLAFEKSGNEIVKALGEQKQIKVNEEKMSILMKGLDSDEQKVFKSVKEQDGITQQTLRLRTGLHKSKLSIVLDRLEKKGLVARKEKGKTKQVFVRVKL